MFFCFFLIIVDYYLNTTIVTPTSIVICTIGWCPRYKTSITVIIWRTLFKEKKKILLWYNNKYNKYVWTDECKLYLYIQLLYLRLPCLSIAWREVISINIKKIEIYILLWIYVIMCVLISPSTFWCVTVNSNFNVCYKNQGKEIRNFNTRIYVWKLK